MSDIRRSPGGPQVRLGGAETQLLIGLVEEFDELLASRDSGGGANTETGGDTDMGVGTGVATGLAGGPDDASADAAAIDPLAELTGLGSLDAGPVAAPSDPALRRLLPDAYRDDAEAASDFRRYTEATLRREKRDDATVVRQGLASIAVTGQRVLDERQAQAWLRFLTDARLMLASWLGIETADDEDRLGLADADDPTRNTYWAYRWLGGLLGDLVDAVDAA